MLNIAPAAFSGSIVPLEPELQSMLHSALQPTNEQTLLQVQTAAGQALIATTARVIILKNSGNSDSGKPLGRFFPWNVVQQFEVHAGLFTRSLIVITPDTRKEIRPSKLARCTFAVTFGSLSLYRDVTSYLLSGLESQIQSQKAAYVNGPLTPLAVPNGIISQHGERFYLMGDAVLYAQHTYRQWQGGTQGVSFRIMRGVYYRVGGIRGRSYNQTVVEPDDRGMLALSDQRLLFVGAHKTIDVPLGRITSVQPFTDGLQVNLSNKQPIQLHTGSDLAGLLLHRLCTNPPP